MPWDYVLELMPAFVARPWGGRALSRWYPGLPAGAIGEAWALSARPEAPSVATNGALAGIGLDCAAPAGEHKHFPMLVKLLHAADDLSIQVHPGDNYAGLGVGESGKTELWFVLHACPGASIIHGLAPGATAADLARAAAAAAIASSTSSTANDALLRCLRRVSVAAGDVVPIPAGTVHALGAGIVVAEVQQNSDTTYRLYDYGRLGLDGRPRQLHIDQALAAMAAAACATSAAAPPEIFRCPPPGSLGRPAALGSLPGGITVGYASIPAAIAAPAAIAPGLLGVLVLEGQVNGARAGHCLLMPNASRPDAGPDALSSPAGATVITLSQHRP